MAPTRFFKLCATITIASLSLSTTTAQEGTILDKSKLPACALTCQLLTQASTLCVPPSAPVSNQQTYQTCFLNSNYMVNYRAGSPNGVCDAECPSASDRKQILDWFTTLYKGGVVVTPSAGTNNIATSTRTSSTSTSTSKSQTSQTNNPSQPTWISIHYKWIIMLIILFLAALAGTTIGIILKKRSNRKQEQYSSNTMLAAEAASRDLSDKHPDTSMAQIPAWNGAGTTSLGIDRNPRHAVSSAPGTGVAIGKGVMGV